MDQALEQHIILIVFYPLMFRWNEDDVKYQFVTDISFMYQLDKEHSNIIDETKTENPLHTRTDVTFNEEAVE